MAATASANIVAAHAAIMAAWNIGFDKAMRLVWLILLGGAVSACSAEPSTDNTMNVEENLTTTDMNINETAAPAHLHNYSFKEGDMYGYVAGISEDERKAGKAAGDVLMFRYAGYWNGANHLEEVTDDGNIQVVAECSDPCVAIKVYSDGSESRIAYNPESVIGEAFEDAMNGHLVRKKSPPPVPSYTPSPSSDSAVAPENTTPAAATSETDDTDENTV